MKEKTNKKGQKGKSFKWLHEIGGCFSFGVFFFQNTGPNAEKFKRNTLEIIKADLPYLILTLEWRRSIFLGRVQNVSS